MISIPRGTTATISSFSVNSRTMTKVSAISRHTITILTPGTFEFTPTLLAFEISRATHNYVEVTYELDAKRFDDVQRIVHIIFGLHC